jgi:dTMP kinase
VTGSPTRATHTRAAGEAWRAQIDALAQLAHPSLAPDLTVLLDAPVALGLARAGARQGSADRFEAERQEFFERVRSAYLERARLEPGRVRIIDAAGTIDEVEAAVRSALAPLLT